MALQGVLLIDKPRGPTSFDVVRLVKKLSGQKRVGHAGTLDPEASGLLVVCLGSYTKLCGYFAEGAKKYEAIIELGIQTSTDDNEGKILSCASLEHLSPDEIIQACLAMIGVQAQIPPHYSAIKINGQRAYKMARADQDFTLKARMIEIYSLEVLHIALPQVAIRVHCSKGTYIRALARDIGKALNVGAHARNIRRIASGAFDTQQALKFADITAQTMSQNCRQDKDALGDLVSFELKKTEYEHIKHGRNVMLNMPMNNHVAIALFDNRPVAVMGKKDVGLEILRVL